MPSLQKMCELLIARQISLRTVLEWLELLKARSWSLAHLLKLTTCKANNKNTTLLSPAILQDDPILSHCEVLRSKCSTMASDAFEALCQMHGITKVQDALPEEK